MHPLAGQRSFDAVARAVGAGQIALPWSEEPETLRKPATRPYEAVEFDGHKMDVRLTLRIDAPFGFETLLGYCQHVDNTLFRTYAGCPDAP